ncbi:MAG TPA: hypothetical protein VMW33_05945 [Ilumatobacteraceae bacterium]|nr:hypothetical protein [Ilumatobacteraceae bacterium]
MPVHHVPVEDLTDFIEELERTRAETVALITPHPIHLGMMLVTTTRPAGLETRGES